MKKYVRLFFEIFSIFSANHKRKLILFQMLILAVSLLEILGIASVMPFIAVLSNPDLISENFYFAKIHEFLHFDAPESFLLFTGSVFLSLMVLSNFLNALNIWAMHLFVSKAKIHFTRQLFKFYLSQNFVFFSSQHSSAIIRNHTQQISRLLSGVILQFMSINSKICVLAFIFLGLIWISPLTTLGIFLIFFISYLSIYKTLKAKMTECGRIISECYTKVNRAIIESVHGFREIKVYRLERTQMEKLDTPTQGLAFAEARQTLYGVLPRYLIETVAFGSLILLCFYFILRESRTSDIFPLISLYAIAGYRMLPQMQQIYNAIASLRANINAYHSLKDQLRASKGIDLPSPSTNEGSMSFTDNIRLENVSFQYPNTIQRQLRGLSLTIKKNDSVGIVGKTGCGKTTLINILLGLIRPESGIFYLDGKHLKTEEDIRKWQKNLAFVSQDLHLIDATILENIGFGLTIQEIDESRIAKVAEIADITEFIQGLPEGFHTLVGERGIKLSGGQKQRIAIARALYSEPEVLILDEATSSLDLATESNLMHSIEKIHGLKTIIMIAHRINTVRKCDVIHLVDEGKILESGTYEELMKKSQIFKSFVEPETKYPTEVGTT